MSPVFTKVSNSSCQAKFLYDSVSSMNKDEFPSIDNYLRIYQDGQDWQAPEWA